MWVKLSRPLLPEEHMQPVCAYLACGMTLAFDEKASVCGSFNAVPNLCNEAVIAANKALVLNVAPYCTGRTCLRDEDDKHKQVQQYNLPS